MTHIFRVFNWEYVLIPLGSQTYYFDHAGLVKTEVYREYYIFGIRVARFRLDD